LFFLLLPASRPLRLRGSFNSIFSQEIGNLTADEFEINDQVKIG
jgi:hypothetical protein